MREKPPKYQTVTYLAKGKQRYSLMDDAKSIKVLKVLGKKFDAEPVVGTGTFLGAYLMKNQNVLEIYEQDGATLGYVFANLDVWLSYPQRYKP